MTSSCIRSTLFALAAAALAFGCGEKPADPGQTTPRIYQGQTAHTLRFGVSDNLEAVRAIPGQKLAVALASKARKLSLLRVEADRLVLAREHALFVNDPSESELTNLDVSPDGRWAALTRTIITKDGTGQQTACGGELVFVDLADSDAFGAILKQVTVGPMPDAVAISPDGKRVVSADERDGPDAWGKCEVPGAQASLSIVSVSNGPANAAVVQRIVMKDGTTGPREPEGVAFGRDSDLVVATLQDSHEVAIFKISALEAKSAPTSDDLMIVALPANALGAKPWPDGIVRFEDGQGAQRFAIAGEWNDSLIIIDETGVPVANREIAAADLPANLPRVIQPDYPLFSPDSLAAFVQGSRHFLAVTLRHAGAVAVYEVTDATKPTYQSAAAVGESETGKQDENGSVIRPEGVCAAADGSFLLTANEDESSVSLVLPAP